MRIYVIALLCAAAACNAYAGTPSSSRHKFYEIDKQAAIGQFGAAEKSACLKAFQSRYQRLFHTEGQLAFSDRLSEMIYDRLYWNGTGSLRRGVAFTAPVGGEGGKGRLICYYAVTDNRLVFQNAFVLPLNKQVASSR